MELRLLRSFVAVAEEGHFGRAAERTHVAQPALSRQVQQLERDLGCRLLDRTTRSVRLTEAGTLLLDRARSVLADLDRARADLADLAAGRLGRVRLGFVGTATYDLLPAVSRAVRAELPGVVLEARGEVLAPDLEAGLRAGSLDVAVTRPSWEVAGDLEVRALRTEALGVLLPAGHPAADQEAVALADLARESLVTHPSGRGSVLHRRVLQACRDAGFEPPDVVEVRETATVAVLVAAGAGIALVPESVLALRLDGVVHRPLAGSPPAVDLVLASRAGAGPAAHQVADVVERLVSARASARSPGR